MPDEYKELFCSFCGKSQHEVRKLIAGPSVFICDECVDLCEDIIAEECVGGEIISQKGPIGTIIDEVKDVEADQLTAKQLISLIMGSCTEGELEKVSAKWLLWNMKRFWRECRLRWEDLSKVDIAAKKAELEQTTKEAVEQLEQALEVQKAELDKQESEIPSQTMSATKLLETFSPESTKGDAE